MRTEIELYLGDEAVEFNADPKILFNYKITDATNPTAIKNSFSKSVTINGTPINNDIFGNIWDLSRVQNYEGNIRTGFNPQKKTPFTIYVDGSIYESGYAKLDSITKKNNQITYTLTLFGGIGELFFNLAYKDEDGKDKKTLADLQYEVRGDDGSLVEVVDMDFTINKDTVFDAWKQILMSSEAARDEEEVDRPNTYYYQRKWDFINFMPAYEGIPDDFDASKILLNSNDNSNYTWTYGNYTTSNGWALGEAEEDLTYNEVRDYRSYLQRPVIRMKEIIKACQNPINNGGWELKLDKTFFNDNNPYWDKSWLTLNLLRDSIEGSNDYVATQATLTPTPGMADYYDVVFDDDTILLNSDFTNVELGIGLRWENSTTTNKDNLYLSYNYDGPNGWTSEKTNYYHYNSAILLQMVGYDETDKVIGTSNVHYLYSNESGLGTDWNGFKSYFEDGVPVPSVDYHTGYFFRDDDNQFVWTGDGYPTAIKLFFRDKVRPAKIRVKLVHPYNYSYKETAILSSNKGSSSGNRQGFLFGVPKVSTSAKENSTAALNRGEKVYGKDVMDVVDCKLDDGSYEGSFTDSIIRKVDYLTTENSPCDYLTAYAKVFGLYFYRDPSESPENDNNKGVIHLLTRKSYYDRTNIVDLEEFIDRSRDIKITPSIAQTKWLNFNMEQNESEASEEYLKTYGYDYGSERINTGFQFNADTTDLLDKVVFKGGIEVLETDKYYTQYISTDKAPFTKNGFSYELYDSNMNTTTITVPVSKLPNISININEWKQTDSWPKLQFHTKDNEPGDGSNVLVFYNGTSYSYEVDNNGYWLTDDIKEMETLNDSTPCWIYTKSELDRSGNYIAYNFKSLPMFGRNIIGFNGAITHSMDMGKPRMTFIRNTFNTDEMSIYSKTWENFIKDMYDDDNRLLNCSVNFNNKPNSEMLRKFYWFDNCIWRINEIKDWNLAEREPVKVEFIKVMDVDNYNLSNITSSAKYSYTFPALKEVNYIEYDNGAEDRFYEIGAEAQTLTARIYAQGTGGWYLGDYIGIEYEDGTYSSLEYEDVMTPPNYSGSGDAIKKFNIPANPSGMSRTLTFPLEDNDDVFHTCYITQAAKKVKSIIATPSTVEFDEMGGEAECTITFNNREDGDEIGIVYNGDTSNWVQAGLSSWNGNQCVLDMAVRSNPDFYKSGSIRLYYLNNSSIYTTIYINQAGTEVPYISVEPEMVECNASYQHLSATIESNLEYDVTSSNSWITIQGYSNGWLEYSVAANTGYSNRTGSIVINGTDGSNVYTAMIVVVQKYKNGTAYFGINQNLTPTYNLSTNLGASMIIPINKTNIASQSFSISDTNNYSIEVGANGNTLIVTAKTLTLDTQPAVITGTFIDTNGNTIYAFANVQRSKLVIDEFDKELY